MTMATSSDSSASNDSEKMHQAQMEESIKKFHVLLDIVPGHLAFVNAQTLAYEFVNKQFEISFGIATDKVIGSHIKDIIGEVNYQFALKYLEAVRAGQSVSYENVFNLVTGKRWIKVNYVPVFDKKGQVISIGVLSYDITEQKLAELEREQFFKFFQTSADMMCIADPQGAFLRTNPACTEILGYSAEELIAKPFIDFIVPEDKQETIDEMTRQMQKGYSLNFENRYLCKDGSVKWLSWRAAFVKEEGITYATARDITDRIVAEANLKKYQQLLTETERIGKVGGWEINIDTLKQTWTEEVYHILEVDLNYEATVETSVDFFTSASKPIIEKASQRAIKYGEPFDLELDVITAKGNHRNVHTIGTADLEHRRVYGFFHDITDRKLAEEERLKYQQQLQQNQKLESLGILAGGIAHDFNNLMGGIFGYIDLANEDSTEEPVKEYLAKAMKTIDRARGLTSQLLTFAKGGAPVQKNTDLAPFIQETAHFILSGSNVACQFSIEPKLWPCNIDKNQIGQVIDNLIINAQQAMPGGGNLEILARNTALREKEHFYLAAGNYVKISIKDNGIGMPKEIIPRIFDPFYTTKSKGHGLGLATCYSITRRHGGSIEVESEPGRGSTFHIYLPASSDAVITSTSVVARHKGSGTILLMDDEKVIQDTLKTMLESMGYHVICKADGRAALDFFLEETGANRKFIAMIFDLTIPGGMGGIDTIAEIRKLKTEIPVFVVSGYAQDPVMKNPAQYGFTASLSKPFKKQDLAEMLDKYLAPRGV